MPGTSNEPEVARRARNLIQQAHEQGLSKVSVHSISDRGIKLTVDFPQATGFNPVGANIEELSLPHRTVYQELEGADLKPTIVYEVPDYPPSAFGNARLSGVVNGVPSRITRRSSTWDLQINGEIIVDVPRTDDSAKD